MGAMDAPGNETEETRSLDPDLPGGPELLSSLVQFGYTLARCEGVQEVLERTLAWACQVTDADDGAIALLGKQREATVMLRPCPSADAVREAAWRRLLGRGIVRWSARREGGWIVPNGAADPGYRDLLEQRSEFRSLLFLPFMQGERLVGMLALAHRAAGHFDLRLLPV
ncbi:MAG: GAF domain-containing protein, partial [Chloroflexia bacterium]